MSDPVLNALNVRDTLARIDGNLAETAELSAEADKFKRDRFLARILAAGASGGAIAAALPMLVRGWVGH